MSMGLDFPMRPGAAQIEVPEFMTNLYRQRFDWFHSISDVEHEDALTCGCPSWELHDTSGMMCDTVNGARPTNFDDFRKVYRRLIVPDQVEVFDQMTDWLEAHPDVFVSFS